MSDITVTVDITVTPSSSGGYSWEVSVDGASLQQLNGVNCFTTPGGADALVTMNIAAGLPDDTCVFQNPQSPNPPDQQGPLMFYTDWRLNETFTPLWFQDLAYETNSATGLANGTITFTDDNMNQDTRIYYFVINAVYNGGNITSPEPTIMNVGTDGGVVIDPGLVSRAQPQPAAQA